MPAELHTLPSTWVGTLGRVESREAAQNRRVDLRARYEEYLAACNERRFDELHRFVHGDVVVNGRPIAAHLVDTGPHTGPVRGLAATGRAVRTHEFAHCRLVGGLTAGVWVTADELAVLDQLRT